MKLPYHNNAHIPTAKLTEYLLSPLHPIGKFKAKYFQKVGFDESNVEQFKQALVKIIHDNNITDIKHTEYGMNYCVEGIVATPTGDTIKIATVWFVKTGTYRPSFVTAYPV